VEILFFSWDTENAVLYPMKQLIIVSISVGSYKALSKIYRWQHKGDERVILADEWRLFVHYALHGALSGILKMLSYTP